MKLRELHIKGFKSIDSDKGQNIPFGDVTVLLGANGAGKSNVISLFDMLHCMVNQKMRQYIGKHGANELLFYGQKKTQEIVIKAYFESVVGNNYKITLSFGHGDRLVIDFKQSKAGQQSPITSEVYALNNLLSEDIAIFLDTKNESEFAQLEQEGSKQLNEFFWGIRAYQFSDTSETAIIKQRGYVDDARFLHRDAGNLAAFLKMLKEHVPYEKYYKRIVQHIHRIMPQFGDFELDPLPGNRDFVLLNWSDSSGNDYLLNPHQISDGSLRFMALAALLLQPPDLLPKFVVLDEPELGLHPAAIAELAGMVKIASQNAQVLLATQSTRLVDEFEPENLVIAERDEERNCSIFRKLDTEQLTEWLERYSLSELWEKNVLGGQP